MERIGACCIEARNKVANDGIASENGKMRDCLPPAKPINGVREPDHLHELFEHHRLELIDAKPLR